MHAPKPKHLNTSTPFGIWNSGYDMVEPTPEQQQQQQQQQQQHIQMQVHLQEHREFQPEYAQTYHQMDYSQQQPPCAPMHNYVVAPALDTLFEPSSYTSMADMMSPPQDQGLEYRFTDMIHDYPSH